MFRPSACVHEGGTLLKAAEEALGQNKRGHTGATVVAVAHHFSKHDGGSTGRASGHSVALRSSPS